MEKEPTIYDHTGKSLRKEKDNSNESLPAGVQALIETRLNFALDQIRERNQDKLDELSRKAKRPWQVMSAFWTIITLLMWLYAPSWIEDKVDKKLTVPAIEESADRIIESKVTMFIDNKIKPLNDQANTLENKIEKLQNDITEASTRAAKANKIAEEERLARVRMELRLAPRSLSAKQQKNIAEKVRKFAPQSFVILPYSDDLEAVSLSQMIVQTLQAAQWKRVSTDSFLAFTLVIGVQVEFSTNDLEQAANSLAAALSKEGIGVTALFKPEYKIDPEIIQIKVGKKP